MKLCRLIFAVFLPLLLTGAESPQKQTPVAVRAYPRAQIIAGRQLEYFGVFAADGKFKRNSRLNQFVDSMVTASLEDEQLSPERIAERRAEFQARRRQPDGSDPQRPVPPGVAAENNRAQTIEDFEGAAHAVQVVRPRSLLIGLRDTIVGFAYGAESVMKAPSSITADSQQRAIVTDPAAHAIHVLDTTGRTSFRIVGGPERRLRTPVAVAVDADDNIYVSDVERGMVLVYDSVGRFLRYIGNYQGENWYQAPTGIAMDRDLGRLYLADTPRHLVFALDLQGNILATFGSKEAAAGPGFRQPTGLAVYRHELLVLDSAGSRLQILDPQGRLIQQFSTGMPPAANDLSNSMRGLCVDSEGLIYISDETQGAINVYSHAGRLLRSLGRLGDRPGEFNAPAGLWTDGKDRFYVVDTNNSRVQIFQFKQGK